MQVVVEHSLLAGCDGRVSLFSANKSGAFYFKPGFTALNETSFDALFYEGQNDIDGGVMFLTNASIEAWKERVSQHPLLANSSELEENHSVNRFK
ncbi:hypothetical protein TUM19329_22270 [Legionella antarctica]|uniref:Uncharacterized protein n=1 Tax=Legionella antarctica TaxID=2708020 RepID=A0A6F8T7C2_9GAMM|nr:hypothetical protein [Legionella antarctica]BCA95866.1 hypothetical protein TUM19329_22270 [Legionella antarctica]